MTVREIVQTVLFPKRPKARFVETLQSCEGPILHTSEVEDGVPLFLSPGFASSLYDYSGLCRAFEQSQPVYRVGHPGSDRCAGLAALLQLAWCRTLGYSSLESALRVRTQIHCREYRERRLSHLVAAVQQVCQQKGTDPIDLAGHSFGTDTALLLALKRTFRIRKLILFSPHPPGYLIPWRDYSRLDAEEVWVVVGSRDWTRDGVGPNQRCLVKDAVGAKGSLLLVEGCRHMDFAFGSGLEGSLRCML